jgi:hypothetical protein
VSPVIGQRWIAIGAIVAGVWLAKSSDLASAKENCQAMSAGPARTDCYIGLSRIHGVQSDVAAGTGRLQSDAARYRQLTGTGSRSNVSKHRQKRTVAPE